MALIKSANSTAFTRGAIVLDLGDLTRQGEAIVAAARRQAETIIAEAKVQRERLIADAAAVGKAEGLAEGMAEGHRQGIEQGRVAALAEHKAAVAALIAGWTTSLEQFVGARERLLSEAKRDVVRIALAIGERVTKRAIEVSPDTVVAQMEAVLELVLRPSRLVVRVHPEDRPMLTTAMPMLLQRFTTTQHVEIIDDPALGRGSCVASLADAAPGLNGSRPGSDSNNSSGGAGGEIDASIATQLDRIAEALLPGERSGAPAHGADA